MRYDPFTKRMRVFPRGKIYPRGLLGPEDISYIRMGPSLKRSFIERPRKSASTLEDMFREEVKRRILKGQFVRLAKQLGVRVDPIERSPSERR